MLLLFFRSAFAREAGSFLELGLRLVHGVLGSLGAADLRGHGKGNLARLAARQDVGLAVDRDKEIRILVRVRARDKNLDKFAAFENKVFGLLNDSILGLLNDSCVLFLSHRNSPFQCNDLENGGRAKR